MQNHRQSPDHSWFLHQCNDKQGEGASQETISEIRKNMLKGMDRVAITQTTTHFNIIASATRETQGFEDEKKASKQKRLVAGKILHRQQGIGGEEGPRKVRR